MKSEATNTSFSLSHAHTHTHTVHIHCYTPKHGGSFLVTYAFYLFGADYPQSPHNCLLVILLHVHNITLARLFLQTTNRLILISILSANNIFLFAPQKSSGCNKMVCWKCNTFFCWLCEERLNPQSPYLHFRNPASKCYNLLFYRMPYSDDEDDDWWVAPGVFLENNDDDYYWIKNSFTYTEEKVWVKILLVAQMVWILMVILGVQK